MVNDIAIQDFVNAIKEQPTETITNYNGKVSKIDKEGVVWVQIHGSTIETPTALTYVKVKQGDEVSLNWRNNKLYVDGNYSTPAVGDESLGEVEDRLRVAIHKVSEDVEEVVVGEYGIVAVWTEYNMSTSNSQFVQASGYTWDVEVPAYVAGLYIWRRTVYEYADGSIAYGDPMFSAQDQVLGEVKYAQDSTNNHFWYDNTGAYVTEEDGTYATGYATRITNAGILQSYNNKLMSSWTNSGIVFYKSDGQTPYVTYGANGITFDSSTGFQIGNNSTYLKWVKEGNTWKLRLQVDSLTIGGDPVLTEQDRLEITSITYAYALSTSGTQIPTSGWQSTPVAPTTTQYAWTRTTVTYSDGHTAVSYTVGGKTGQNGQNGTNGTNGTNGRDGTSVTITSTSVKYASQSASASGAGTTPPSSGWSTSVPSVAAGDYLWSRTIVTYSDNTSTTSYAVARNGTNGSDITSQYLSWSTTGGLTLGYNNFIQSKLNLKGDGVRIYNGAGNLGARLHAEGMTVYDGTATTESEATEVASFGEIARLGTRDGSRTEILPNEISMFTADGVEAFNVSASGSSETRWKYVSVHLNIEAGSSDTLSLSSSIPSGETVNVYVINSGVSTTETISLTAGQTSSGSGTRFSYSYNGSANSLRITARYDVQVYRYCWSTTTYSPLVKINGVTLVDELRVPDMSKFVIEMSQLNDFVTFRSESNGWKFCRWKSGIVEAWGSYETGTLTMNASGSLYRSSTMTVTIPDIIFDGTPTFAEAFVHNAGGVVVSAGVAPQSATSLNTSVWKATNNANSVWIRFHLVYYP